jgi:hypothetical protein
MKKILNTQLNDVDGLQDLETHVRQIMHMIKFYWSSIWANIAET